MDTIAAERRSENMRRIRSKDMKPEMTVRRMIHGMGYRYRLHVRDLPGKPDLVFPARKKAVWVHGCFWHQHEGCKEAHVPKSRLEYWLPKLEKNQARDRENRRKLEALGWRVLIIWECETGGGKRLEGRVRRFLGPR